MPYASKTKIIPSPLADQIRFREKAPAMLCRTIVDGCQVDPMEKALKGYDVPITIYDDDILEAASSTFFAHINNVSQFHEEKKRGIVTLDEVICGIPDDPYYDGMNWKTSAGYPWCKEVHAGFSGKEWWFGKNGIHDKST